MNRSLFIFVWILLGAIASGSSIGYALHAANLDRRYLAEQTQRARAWSERAQTESQHLAEEANQKVSDANAEVERAQETINALLNERDLLRRATILPKPSPTRLRGWSAYASLPLGITVSLPPQSIPHETETGLIVTEQARTGTDVQWMTVLPFDSSRKEELEKRLADSESASFAVQGYVLTGIHGTLIDEHASGFVLTLMNAPSSTALLWARTTPTINEQTVLDVLATITPKP